MIINKLLKYFGLLCIFLSVLLFWQRNNPKRVMFLSAPIQREIKPLINKNLPTRLIINNINIDLPIFPARIYSQKWETTNQGASWLDISPAPGEIGNSIIYGHNWTNLLGNLTKAKPGNIIKIVYQDGSSKTFIVNSTAMVLPENVSVLKQTKDKRITLYTCVGLFDQKRFVVVAQL